MVRTRSRALVEVNEEHCSDPENDAVEQHVARRHARLEEIANGSDSDSEGAPVGNQVVEREVLDIDISSSEDEDEQSPLPAPDASRLHASDDDGDDDGEEDDDDDDGNWGGRRRKYHGADTGEHEIMEDEERDEALQEEEEEALRLQRKALAGLQPSDYGVADDYDDGDDSVSSEGEDEPNAEKRPGNLAEVGALAVELNKYYELLEVWKNRLDWGKLAVTRFHLYASYTTNIAYYFALLSDPESANLDVREHPVLRRIVDLRTLINAHETIAISIPEDSPPPSPPAVEKQPAKEVVRVAEDAPEDDEEMEVSEPQEVVVLKKRKKTKKKKSSIKIVRAIKARTTAEQGRTDPMLDENLVDTLLSERNAAPSNFDEYGGPSAAEKRRRLNRITGKLDSQAKNATRRRVQSADTDHIRAPFVPKAPAVPEGDFEGGEQDLDGLGDDEFVGHMLQKPKKQSRKRARKEVAAPHVYTFDDQADVESRRRASSQVVLNRGLTRYRPKEKKTPRTKNKAAYANALKRHKLVSRQVVDRKPGVSYGGEATGINMNAVRSSSLSKF